MPLLTEYAWEKFLSASSRRSFASFTVRMPLSTSLSMSASADCALAQQSEADNAASATHWWVSRVLIWFGFMSCEIWFAKKLGWACHRKTSGKLRLCYNGRERDIPVTAGVFLKKRHSRVRSRLVLPKRFLKPLPPSPEGTTDNSPARERWVTCGQEPSPDGTAHACVGRPFGTYLHSRRTQRSRAGLLSVVP